MSSPIIWAGTAAKSLKSILQLPGSTSGTLSLTPAASTSSHTLTFPASQGGATTVLTNDGSGGLSWAANGSALLATAAKTANYTLTSSDSFISGSATGAAFTLTLPTAVGISGKIFYLSRSDQTLANLITVATTSSQTIGAYGTSVTLATQGESWVVVSDGTNWQVLDHNIPLVWTAYTPTGGGFTWTNTQSLWARSGANIKLLCTGNVTSAAATTATLSLPSGLTTASSSILRSTSPYNIVGPPIGNNAGSATLYVPLAQSGVTSINFGGMNAATNGYNIGTATGLFGNSTLSIMAEVPIANWNG